MSKLHLFWHQRIKFWASHGLKLKAQLNLLHKISKVAREKISTLLKIFRHIFRIFSRWTTFLWRSVHLYMRTIIYYLASYAYILRKPVIFLLILIAGGTIVFYLAHDSDAFFKTKLTYYMGSLNGPSEVKDKTAYVAPPIKPHEYPSFQPILYSIEVATPILDFGQESHFDIKGSWRGFKFYKWIHTFFGWVFSILIVLSPTKLLRRE